MAAQQRRQPSAAASRSALLRGDIYRVQAINSIGPCTTDRYCRNLQLSAYLDAPHPITFTVLP
jgi:hypothetical protein